MALFKKGRYWQFDFYFRKTRHQGSTQCTNKESAKLWLAKFRTNLAFQRVGLVEHDPPPLQEWLRAGISKRELSPIPRFKG